MNQKRQLTKTKITAHILSASTNIKFKCLFTLLWRTTDKSLQAQTTPVEPQNGSAQFNQSLTLETQTYYDSVRKEYSGVETELLLRLISKNKQGEAKLIGRVTYDLGKILNGEVAAFEKTQLKLEFCSVNGKITVMFEVGEQQTVQIESNEEKDGAQKEEIQKQVVRFKRQSPQKATRVGSAAPKSPPSFPPIKKQEQKSPLTDIALDRPQSSASISSPVQPSPQPRSSSRPQLQQPLDASLRHQSTERSQQINNSVDHIRFKTLEDDFKRESSKHIHENQLMAIALKQKEQLLIESDQQLKKVMKELRRDREELGKKMEENVELQLLVAGLKGQNSRMAGDIAQAARSYAKLKDLMGQLEKEGQIMRKEMTDQITSLQTKNNVLTQKCSQLAQDLSISQSTAHQIHSQFTALQTKYTSQAQQHQKQHHFHHQQLKKQHQELQKMATTVEEQKSHIKKLIEQATIATKEYSDNMTNKNKEIQNWKEQTRIALSKNEQLEERIRELESTVIRVNQEMQESIMEGNSQIQKIKHELSKQIQILKIKSNTLEEDNQRLKISLAELDQQLQINKAQTAEKIHSLQLLQSQQQSLLLQNQALLSQNSRLFSKLLQLQQLLLTTNDQKTRQLTSAQEQQHSVHIRLLELQQQLRQSQYSQKKYEQKIERLEWEISEGKNLIDKLKEGVKKQMEKNQELNRKIMRVSQINERYVGQVRQLEGQISNINQLLQQAQQTQTKLKQRAGDYEQQMKDMLATLEKSQSNQQLFRSQVTAKIQQLNVKEMQLGQLRKYVQQQKMLIENNNHDIAQKDRIINELEDKVSKEELKYREVVGNMNASGEEIKQMLAAQKQKRDELDKKNKQHIETIRKMQKELRQAIKQNQSLKEQIETKQSYQNDRNESQQSANIQKIRQLHKNIQNMNSQFQQKEQFYKGNITQLMETLENVTMDHQEQRNQDAERMIDLRKHVTLLENKVRQMQDQYDKSQESKVQNVENKVEKVEEKETETITKPAADQSDKIIELQLLLKEKQEQLDYLQQDFDRLAAETQQIYQLREQVQAYKQQLQINEQQIFNLQAACNEKNYEIMELENQNARLNEDIELMVQRNNDIEEMMDTKNQQNGEDGKEQLLMLRDQVKELEVQNAELKDKIEEKDEEHVVQLIDQHIRLSKSDLHNSNLAKSVSRLPKDLQTQFIETCNNIKQLLSQRKELLLVQEQKTIPGVEQLPKYARMVSLELQKAKLQLLKDQRKVSIGQILKPCEQKVKTLCEVADQCCTE